MKKLFVLLLAVVLVCPPDAGGQCIRNWIANRRNNIQDVRWSNGTRHYPPPTYNTDPYIPMVPPEGGSGSVSIVPISNPTVQPAPLPVPLPDYGNDFSTQPAPCDPVIGGVPTPGPNVIIAPAPEPIQQKIVVVKPPVQTPQPVYIYQQPQQVQRTILYVQPQVQPQVCTPAVTACEPAIGCVNPVNSDLEARLQRLELQIQQIAAAVNQQAQ